MTQGFAAMPGKHKARKRARGELEEDDGAPKQQQSAANKLNNVLQKILRRTLKTGELAISVWAAKGAHTAKVRVPECSEEFGAQDVKGDVGSTEKEAIENACNQALELIMGDANLKALYEAEREVEVREKPVIEHDPNEPEEMQKAKPRLATAVMKIFRGSLQKGNINYETLPCDEGFISTVTCNVLPGEWASKSFTGKPAENELKAEKHAAMLALEAINGDDELMGLHNRKVYTNRGKGGGKGKKRGMGEMAGMMGGMNPYEMGFMMMASMMGMDGMGGMPPAKRQRRG